MPTLFTLWRYRTTGKQCGLTATGDYQPSRSLSMADSAGKLFKIGDLSLFKVQGCISKLWILEGLLK
jgi:hypothetical protein